MMKKLLYVTPHLSTGGLPQYLLKKIRLLKDTYDIYLVEYTNVSDAFVVQKNALKALLGKKMYTLGENKRELLLIIASIKPDIIHLEEIPEYFIDYDLTKEIYSKNRGYILIETTHSSDYDTTKKVFVPDKFMGVCQCTTMQYVNHDIPMEIIEFSVDKKPTNKSVARSKVGFEEDYKHVVTVGLFTQRKNQGYVFEIAKKLVNRKIKFHFIGNQADNFKFYWEPILRNKPSNCIIHGEKSNVREYLEACDVSVFASKGTIGDMELNPLVIKETLEAGTKLLMYNLDVYLKKYDNNPDVIFLTGNIDGDAKTLESVLESEEAPEIPIPEVKDFKADFTFEASENKIFMNYYGPPQELCLSIRELSSNVPIYYTNLTLPGDIFGWWFIPVRYIPFMSFMDKPHFSGFRFEFFDIGKEKLAKSVELKLKELTLQVPKLKISPFDCAYINFEEFFGSRIYDDFIESLGDLDVAVDIGANIGVFVNYLLHKGVKKIYAVEPEPTAIKSLKYALDDKPNVSIIPYAVTNENGTRQFYTTEGNTTISSFYEEQKNFNPNSGWFAESVNTITFQKIIDDYGINKIDFLKIDVEGSEYEIFDTLGKEDFDKIENMLIEFHMNTNGRLKEHILSKLDEYGYEYDIQHQSTSKKMSVDEAIESLQGSLLVKKKKVHADELSAARKVVIRKAFITHCNATYIPLAKQLVKSVLEFTDLPIIVYGIDCDVDISEPRVIIRKVDTDIIDPKRGGRQWNSHFAYESHTIPTDAIPGIDGKDANAYRMLSLKPTILEDAMLNGLEQGIYLDADGMARKNIVDLYQYFSQVPNYPLVGEGVHNFLILDGKWPIENDLMDLMDVKQRTMHYVASNVMVFDKKCLPFIKEWKEACSRLEILAEPRRYAPFQDETVLNVLLWKNNAMKKLPLVHFNVRDLDSYIELCTTTKRNEFLGTEWQKIPDSESDIKFLHGCKSPAELEKILNHMIESQK